eukprot:TRINITY_DN117_c0_g1_i2.p1 TRINITY_DN117_c0_g1~~TRINITY_DN117_c0_g1_i2.p1  ORF type:complete len:196 (-),score=19.30 TRINITY_DN117_c0_g1_i2:235-822(-)
MHRGDTKSKCSVVTEGPKKQGITQLHSWFDPTRPISITCLPSSRGPAKGNRPRHSIGSITLPLGRRLLVKGVRQPALATVVAVLMGGHEDASAARLMWALAAEALHLAIVRHLVVLEHRHRHLLLLVLDLLGLGVRLLFPLLATAKHTQRRVDRRAVHEARIEQRQRILIKLVAPPTRRSSSVATPEAAAADARS